MLYVAIATRAFRRYSTYRAATLAGVFTNSVFGVIYSFAYLALWDANPTAGGYDKVDAVTYVWLGQALLMTVALWGGGTTDDLAERIRTGDVAIDLYRPGGGDPVVPRRGPRPRDVPPAHARPGSHRRRRGPLRHRPAGLPGGCLGFLVSVPLAVVVSFGLRFLVASTAFWLLDATGARTLSGALAIFFSGMALPLVLFPGWLGILAESLPWSAMIQVPNDIWLGRHTGVDLLGAPGLPGRLGRGAARSLLARARAGHPQGGGPGWLTSRPWCARGTRSHATARSPGCGSVRRSRTRPPSRCWWWAAC